MPVLLLYGILLYFFPTIILSTWYYIPGTWYTRKIVHGPDMYPPACCKGLTRYIQTWYNVVVRSGMFLCFELCGAHDALRRIFNCCRRSQPGVVALFLGCPYSCPARYTARFYSFCYAYESASFLAPSIPGTAASTEDGT